MSVNLNDLKDSYTYTTYQEHLAALLNENKTTGHVQSEMLVAFTRLNTSRMARIDKTLLVLPELKDQLATFSSSLYLVVLTEGWCGDSAQTLPIINKISELSNGRISLHIVLRDDHPSLMNSHLTAGTRSIPKLIALTEHGHEVFAWGPRPAPAQQIMLDWKAKGTVGWEQFEQELHGWYAKDKGFTTQVELGGLLAKYSRYKDF